MLLAAGVAVAALAALTLLGSDDGSAPAVHDEGRGLGVPAPASAPPAAARPARPAAGPVGGDPVGKLPEREVSNDPTADRPAPALRPSARDGEVAGTRSGSSVLYESEEGQPIDTTSAVDAPLEDGFPPRGTVSFWLNPSWGGTNQDDASFVDVADGRLRLVKNVSFLRFEAVDAKGFADGVGLNITEWGPEDWHYVTATWDEGVITLYVDGVLVGQKFIPWLDLPADSRLTLGSRFPPGRPIAIGTMATFALQGRPLGADAVGRKFERTPPPLPDDDAKP